MKIWKIIWRILLVCILIIFICVGTVVYQGYAIYSEALKEIPLEEMISQIKEKDNYTTIDEMPQIYLDAVISVEDHRFYKHSGFDLLAITRAVKNDIKAKSFVEGGSTITQQLAKNTYFTQEKKITRKIAEVFMAIEFESKLEKNDILELYLNTSYFGEGCYTVSEASRVYFDKEPADMNDYEATMLAGIPNAPSVYAPTKNPDLAKQRQRQVLDKMVEYGKISLDHALEILDE